MKVKLKNNIKFYLLCTILGACVGAIIWAVMRLISLCTNLIWNEWSSFFPKPIYTITICLLCGLAMGLIHKFTKSDYPDDMDFVMKKIKTEKHYSYDKIIPMIFSIFIPLVCGASVGPEAGLTCLIASLCYWVGDNIKFAKVNSAKYTSIGVSAALGVLFHSPLFGFFEPAEEIEGGKNFVNPKKNNIFAYAASICGAIGIYSLLGLFFGGGLGLPYFSFTSALTVTDYLMIVVYLLCGVFLGLLFLIFSKINKKFFQKIPVLLREIVGGLVLGVGGTLLPLAMFSGEEQSTEIMNTFTLYSPWILILIAVVKLFLTSSCISSGLKGGHFFPIIFCGITMGYGVSMLMGNIVSVNAVFAVAIITAALLGVTLGKPLAVTTLLFLLFPVRYAFVIFIVSALSAKLSNLLQNKKLQQHKF